MVPATGRSVDILTVDVLTLQPDGRVSEVCVLADELGVLLSLDALTLGAPPPASSRA